MTGAPVIESLGESTLLLRFGSVLDVATNARVHATAALLHTAQLPGIIDIVPAYATLGLHYDPAAWVDANGNAPSRHIAAAVATLLGESPIAADHETATVEIPVAYGGAFGPDIAELARHAGISEDALIVRHSAARYHVAMLGFAPGFPYLLGLDPLLAMPRRSTPRTRVPAGSVAIGGAQTGIYPKELPGGWQLIGRTPLVLFDATRDPASLLFPGDTVRFIPIGADTFAALEAKRR